MATHPWFRKTMIRSPPRNLFLSLFAVINPIALLHHSLSNDPIPRDGLAM
jgi:hypothetical protein